MNPIMALKNRTTIKATSSVRMVLAVVENRFSLTHSSGCSFSTSGTSSWSSGRMIFEGVVI